ncbi:unnamed protein product [Notodromas monacha]|uniref:DNA repair protein RAD50 n=1 Tax=Notodromas monacha TaxID=399045 RepID=A0A7R9BFD6_9CRUS|nr:unnamed protein product [Notodromas monacha]CAG0913483.1 unnamed protein product [Notodromas monacha]
MSTFLGMSVNGVRSFCPGREEKIEFEAPLTLILGQNGCGKTTLIESLKLAVSGDYPPQSDMGRSFIHDPKMTDTSKVRATVKLRFVGKRDTIVEVCRNVEVQLKSDGKLQLKTVDCAIRKRHIHNLWPPKMATSKCIDVNQEIEHLLGVPKAVMTDVMFCHQEDSNWPLDEPKRVKEKFDKIFSADKYIKGMNEIHKKRKKIQEDLKESRLRLTYSKSDREMAKSKRLELRQLESKLEVVEADLERLKGESAALKQQRIELATKEEALKEARSKKDRSCAKLDYLRKTADDLLESVGEEPGESKEDLLRHVESFPTRIENIESELKSAEAQLEKCAKSRKTFNNQRDADQKRLGQLESEEKIQGIRVTRRLEEARKLVDDYHIVPGNESSGEFVDQVAAQLDSLLEDKKMYVETMRFEWDEAIQACANKLGALREERSGIQTEIRLKKESIATWGTEAQAKKKKCNSSLARDSEQQRQDLNDELASLDADIVKEEQSSERDACEAQCNQLNEERAAKKQRRKQLKAEYDELAEKQAAVTQAEELRKDLKSKREAVDKAWDADMRDRFGQVLDVADVDLNTLTLLLDEKHASLEEQLKCKEAEARRMREEHGLVKAQFQHANERLAKLGSGIQELDVKLKKSLGAEKSLQTAMDENQSRISELSEAISEGAAFGKLMDKFVAAFRCRSKPHCLVCNRGFVSAEEAESAAVAVKQRIQGAAKMDDLQAEFLECQQKSKMLESLLPVSAKRAELQKEKPALQKEVEELERETSSGSANLTAAEKAVEEMKELLSKCRLLFGPAESLSLRLHETQALKLKLSAAERNLGLNRSFTETPKKTLAEAKAELDDLEHSLEKIDFDVQQLQTKREQRAQKLLRLRQKRVGIEDAIREVRKALEEGMLAEQRLMELERWIHAAKGEVELKEKELRPMEDREKNLLKEKSEAEDKKRRVMDSGRQEMERLKSQKAEFERTGKEIEEYKARGVGRELEEVRRKLVAVARELDSNTREEAQVRERVSGLQSEVGNSKLRHQQLKSSLKLLETREAIQAEEEQLKELTAQYEKCNPTHLLDQIHAVSSKWIHLEKETTEKAVERNMMQKNAEERRVELEEKRLKDAHVLYAKGVYELSVLEGICEDLNHYYICLDKAILKFHSEKMSEINRILEEMWRETYRGGDIDYIQILTERNDKDTDLGLDAKRRVYNYRVVMFKGTTMLDMRGRCSAGQKILACLIIRMALAQAFGANCGVLALDEPTTNLDSQNIAALAEALMNIVDKRRGQQSFQLVIITHDVEFLNKIIQKEKVSHFFKVSRNLIILPPPVQSGWDADAVSKPTSASSSSSLPGVIAVIASCTAPPYGDRKGWVPRNQEDYGDGGAYPEVAVAQYPLGMGRSGQQDGAKKSNAVAVQLDASGKVKYDVLARQGARADKVIYSKFTDLLPASARGDLGDDDLRVPDDEEVDETTTATREALEKLTQSKITAAMPVRAAEKTAPAQYIRYTPAQQGAGFNSGAKQRIIRMVEVQKDPMEPPRFKINQKIPRGPPSPPAPVLHSPTRKVTVKEQQEWKIPPCISNWKNAKGYTIPLDKRLAADGRGLQQMHINEKFAKLAESLFIADRKAREAVELRATMEKRLAKIEKEKREEHLRQMAQRARDERAGLGPSRPSRHEDDVGAGVGGSRDEDPEEAARRERDALRQDRHRERHWERKAGGEKKKAARERERDITEQIALGKPSRGPGGGSEAQFDQRLFNQSKGMDSGFGDDEAYNVYDQAWRSSGTVGQTIYRPSKSAVQEGLDYERLAQGNRFVSEKNATSTGLTGPVQFEKHQRPGGSSSSNRAAAAAADEGDDPFGAGLEDFFKQAIQNKRSDKDDKGGGDQKRRRRE